MTWRGAEGRSPKNPTPRRLSRGIREGEENQGGVCTQKPTGEQFTNKPGATGEIKSDYSAAELKGTSEEADR